MKYHVAVTGSAPEKGAGNKFLPMPQENIDFIKATLMRLNKSDYAAIYHGASAGVDTVADDFAFEHSIRVKQFPAYWFDPVAVKEKPHINKSAGFFRNEAMLRALKDATHNKDFETATVLVFFNTAKIEDDKMASHVAENARKREIDVRTFQLPILVAADQPVVAAASSGMPNPFGN